MSLLLLLSCTSLGQCQKTLAKSEGFRKNIKRGDGHIGGLSTEGGVQTFCMLILRG